MMHVSRPVPDSPQNILHFVPVMQTADLPPNLVPHLKLGFCHFMLFNVVVPLALEDGKQVNNEGHNIYFVCQFRSGKAGKCGIKAKQIIDGIYNRYH
jgi:hypothetical protein